MWSCLEIATPGRLINEKPLHGFAQRERVALCAASLMDIMPSVDVGRCLAGQREGLKRTCPREVRSRGGKKSEIRLRRMFLVACPLAEERPGLVSQLNQDYGVHLNGVGGGPDSR